MKFIKEGMAEEIVKESDEKTKQIVANTLKDIEEQGDKAVRDLSIKFDKWDPEQFKLSQAQIKEIVDSIPEEVKHDIAFAQDNIKKFAEAQRDSMKDIHVEVMPGVFLGHKNIPVESVDVTYLVVDIQ